MQAFPAAVPPLPRIAIAIAQCKARGDCACRVLGCRIGYYWVAVVQALYDVRKSDRVSSIELENRPCLFIPQAEQGSIDSLLPEMQGV